MNRELVKAYIDSQPTKVVKFLDLANNKIQYDLIDQKSVITDCKKPEEITRAYILTKLVNEYGYDPRRIEIENTYKSGRPKKRTKPRIDIIVRDINQDAFLFIEVKNPDEYKNLKKSRGDDDEVIENQLYRLAFMEMSDSHKVKYLVLYSYEECVTTLTDKCMVIDLDKYPTFKIWSDTRNYDNCIPVRYGKAQRKPYIKDSDHDLTADFTSEMLLGLQNQLHNVLWGGGGTDDNEIFASLTNLILAKIQDEDTTESGEKYCFQSFTFENSGEEDFETNEQLFDRINGLYREALKSKLYILDENELKKSYVIDTKKFSLSKLKYAVQKLEGLSLVDGKNSLDGKDFLGDFFEGIIRDGFKQTKGQFFTPINLVTFMLWGIQADRLAIKRITRDHELPYMIDPSAGSGTFLIEYMKFITENMKYRFRDKLGTSRAIKDKIESDWFYPDYHENKWAQTYIYAIESNFNLGTATKVNMILHGDGSTNVFVKDGLLPFTQYEKEVSPNILHDSAEKKLYYDKNVNENFDLILTNPPFNVNLDNDTKRMVKNNFLFGDKKNSENLFIERWYQLLRENGRLAAILPENVFDITEDKYIRLFLYKYFKIKAVVSLPQMAFEPYTSTKTSILFAQKKTDQEVEKWNECWNEASNRYQKVKTRVDNILSVYLGHKEKDKLPSIKELTEDEEKKLIFELLRITPTDELQHISLNEVIMRFIDKITEIFDSETSDVFGFVNTWWVFSEVSLKMNYEIFMSSVDNIGYKRTKRGVKTMPNELFCLEYAPSKIASPDILNEYLSKLDDKQKKIDECDSNIKSATSNAEKEKMQKAKSIYEDEEQILNDEYQHVKDFLEKYYKDGLLKKEYEERDDQVLIDEFKSGYLQRYASLAVAFHEKSAPSLLDVVRKIEWD